MKEKNDKCLCCFWTLLELPWQASAPRFQLTQEPVERITKEAILFFLSSGNIHSLGHYLSYH